MDASCRKYACLAINACGFTLDGLALHSELSSIWLSVESRLKDQVKTAYASSDDPTVQNRALIPEAFGEEHNNTLAFDYYVEAYYVFLQGSDDFTEQRQELEERYGIYWFSIL